MSPRKEDICTDYFQKVHPNSPLHRHTISQIETKRSGVGVETFWSTPTPTPTPGSLPRLRATLTPAPTLAPHPCSEYPTLIKFSRSGTYVLHQRAYRHMPTHCGYRPTKFEPCLSIDLSCSIERRNIGAKFVHLPSTCNVHPR